MATGNKTMKITGKIPGGNIRVVSVDGHHAELDNELRDTAWDWFYWCFDVQFDEAGEYSFHFVKPNRIGTRGPAVSLDEGRSWRWLSETTFESNQDFSYVCPVAGQTVRFCMCMQYLQSDWERFVKEAAVAPWFQAGVLCHSRKGRPVELAEIREGNPKVTLLLTTRHHCAETMATYALEGILRYALTHPEFRRNIGIIAVPFVDKDGVEDGDQGKSRKPHDHCRDYLKPSIYPETAALRRLIDDRQVTMILDMHCPWIRGGDNNEFSYLVGDDNPDQEATMTQFAELLEQESTPKAPYFAKYNVPFGQDWNNASAFVDGWPIRTYGGTRPSVKFSQTMEIPFANFGGVTVDGEAMLDYGYSIARTLLKVAETRGWTM